MFGQQLRVHIIKAIFSSLLDTTSSSLLLRLILFSLNGEKFTKLQFFRLSKFTNEPFPPCHIHTLLPYPVRGDVSQLSQS